MARITEELRKSFNTGGMLIKDNTRFGTYQYPDNLMEKTYEKISVDLYDLPPFVIVYFNTDYGTMGLSSVDQYILCPIDVNPQEYLNSITVGSISFRYRGYCDLHTHFMNKGRTFYSSFKDILKYDLVKETFHIKSDCFHFQCIDIIMCNYNTRKRYEELSTLYDDLFTNEDDVRKVKNKTKISFSIAHVLIIIGILGLIMSPFAADIIGTLILCAISSSIIGIGIADITIED